MARNSKRSIALHKKYDDKEVCFSCEWSETDEDGRLYCTNTRAKDCSDFVPCAHTCKCYEHRNNWHRKA